MIVKILCDKCGCLNITDEKIKYCLSCGEKIKKDK